MGPTKSTERTFAWVLRTLEPRTEPKDVTMRRFTRGGLDVLIATTVIEVVWLFRMPR